jgi:hypothetical protein
VTDAERVYTAEEATDLLPDLKLRLARIRDARQVLIASSERVRDRVAADAGGGSDAGRGYWEASRTLKAEIERLAAEDIVLRDPEQGLVDFPGELEGRRVWLCWRVGEDRVANWHELDSGFAGRKPL